MPDIDYDALHTALSDATTKAFAAIQALTQHEQLYVFGLYTSDEYLYIVPTANTEEGLVERAQHATATDRRSIEDRMAVLRWNACDWKYHGVGQEFFGAVEACLGAGWADDFSAYSGDREMIKQICLRVLHDCRTLLVRDGHPQESVLNLFAGDVATTTLLQSAAALNPPYLYRRYKADLERSTDESDVTKDHPAS